MPVFEQKLKEFKPSRRQAAVFIVGFGLIGGTIIFTSRAASPTASVEPENSTITSPAALVSDNNASGGSAVKFGAGMPAPIFEVKTYGAKGDGVTNDTIAIQAALDAANNSGGSLHFPAGTYMISTILRYGTRLTISGDGMDVTTIKNLRSRTDLEATSMLMPKQDGTVKQNVTVQRMTFDQEGDYFDAQWGSAAYDALLMSVGGTNNMTVQDSGFRQVRTIAIWSDNAIAYDHVSNLKVLRNHVYKANGDAFSFFGNITDSIIDGNIVEDTADEAIAFQATAYDYPKRIQITNNTILDCIRRARLSNGDEATPNGINTWGSDMVTVSGNVIRRVLASGIKVGQAGDPGRRSTNITVTNNTVDGTSVNNHPPTSGVPSYGIFFSGADNVTGSNNTLINNPYGNIGAVYNNTNIHGFPPNFP